MNKDATVEHMISYIESAEKKLQTSNLSGEQRSGRADIVNEILSELEREVLANEDQAD